MARNYGYGPTKLRPAALYNELREKRFDAVSGGGGGDYTSDDAAELFGTWMQAEQLTAYNGLLAQYPTMFDDNQSLMTAIVDLNGFYSTVMTRWSGMSAHESAVPFTPVTPHAKTDDPDSDGDDIDGWMIDLNVPSVGGIEINDLP